MQRAFAATHLHWRAVLLRLAARAHRLVRDPRTIRFEHIFGRILKSRVAVAVGVVAAVVVVTGLALSFRLTSGPLTVNLATPWLISSLEQQLGGGHRVEVGGTQLERDEAGRTSLRIRDIVVKAADGSVVANAPKAEIGISGGNLLLGNIQAERVSLIGAGISIRIEPDGAISLFTGTDAQPLAKAPVFIAPVHGNAAQSAASPAATRNWSDNLTALLGWIEGLDALGLDGRGLSELGVKSGTLVVDDQRNGRVLRFEHINLSLTRPREGGISFAITSSGSDGPWSLTATVTRQGGGRRAVEAVLRDFSPKDLMLAMRVDPGPLAADMPISAILRADIGADGVPARAEARIVAGAGIVGDPKEPANRVQIDEAHLNLRWDAASGQLAAPIEVLAGKSRVSLLLQAEAPKGGASAWTASIDRGLIMLAPPERVREAPLVIDRFAFRARIDPVKRRMDIDRGDFAGMAATVAMSGAIDFSGAEPHIGIGVAGTRMSALSFKRLWPIFIAPELRAWVAGSLFGGTVERVVVAANAPLSTFQKTGPPIPDDGLSVEIVGTKTVLRPIDSLPMIRDVDLHVRVEGRKANVRVGRGYAELPSGRRLTLANGSFEVPDTDPKRPPSRLRMRVEGTVDAVAELVAMDPIREPAGALFDPATSRGTLTANINVNTPVAMDIERREVNYQIEADIQNFSAERFVRGHKAEAAALKLVANPQMVQVRGDMRIGGTPATVEYRKLAGNPDAEIRLSATLDDAARARFGVESGNLLSGPVPMKMTGRVGMADRESRFVVDLDLLQAKITDLIPGWNKAAGRPTRASVIVVDKGQSIRFDDIVIEGSGTSIRGSAELDNDGEVLQANFPSFAISDGDKASLKAERASDGTLRLTLRGDVFDGRGFVKATMKGAPEHKPKAAADIDLDLRIGAVAGFNGEALRSFEMRMSRRAGQVRSFLVNAKLGRDAVLSGDLRGRGGRQVVYLETNDAGALFRFSDTYARLYGGQMWIAMDPPSGEQAPQDGILSIRDFAVRGEAALDRVAASSPQSTGDSGPRPASGPANGGVQFSRMRLDFTRSPGRLSLRDGVVWGPSVGATIEGHVDFARDEVRARGTFIPAYMLNNMLARIPIVGLFLGGGKDEGVFGVTYEVSGTPGAPLLRVNPMSAVAPGIFRKMFEFRGTEERAFAPPQAVR